MTDQYEIAGRISTNGSGTIAASNETPMPSLQPRDCRPSYAKPRKRNWSQATLGKLLCRTTTQDVVDSQGQGGLVQTTIDSTFKKENRKAIIKT